MRREFLYTVLWRAAAAASSVASALISFRLYEHYLSPTVYGLVQVALVVITNLPLFDGGFRTAVNRGLLMGNDPAERRQLLDFVQWFNTWLAGGAAVVGVLAMLAYRWTPNARESGEPVVFFLSLGVLGGLVLLAAAQSQLLLGLGVQRQMFIINAGAPWVNLFALWWGLSRGWAAWAFLFSQLVTGLAVIWVVWAVLRLRFPETPLLVWRRRTGFGAVFHRLKGEAVRVLACQASSTLLYMADSVLVGAVLTGRDVGRFALMARLFSMMRSLLQSADEALWPVIAAKAGGGVELSQFLGRLNGWVHGAIMTAAALTLPPFVRFYVGPDWEPTAWMVAFMALRNLITGLASQPAAYLYGTGRFPTLAGGMFRELVLGVVLGWVGARFWGTTGAAAGFLVATLGGTLVPLPVAFARLHGWSPAQWLTQSWVRAGVAAVVSGGLAFLVARWSPGVVALIVGAALSVAAALLTAVLQAWWRSRSESLRLLPALMRYL